jgi:hypothetical protein
LRKIVQALTTQLLSQACRTFLSLAYPEGPDTIPEPRRIYWDMAPEQPLSNFMLPTPQCVGICKNILSPSGEVLSMEFRLGSVHFKHLKMRIQEIANNGQPTLVFMVDTHDAFSSQNRTPPADHPDAPAWRVLQDANRQLKERIEAAWESQGLATSNSLLRGK